MVHNLNWIRRDLNKKVIYIIFTIIFLHFVIFRPLNFPFTFGLIGCLILIPALHKSALNKKFLDYAVFAIVIIVFHAPELIQSHFDLFEYLKTYALWTFTAIVILSFASLEQKGEGDCVAPAAFFSLVLISLFTVIQSYFASNGSVDILNIFGERQYFGVIDTATLMQDEKYRPPGFYLEPSFCAYVATSLLAICLISGYRIIAASIFAFLAVFSIQSLTGILSFFFTYIVYIIVRNRVKFSDFLIGAIGVSIFLAFIMEFYGDYVILRYEQVFTPGTSTYYRTVALIPVLLDTLVNAPFGNPFGRVQEVVSSYNIPHGVSFGTSIDNGIYLLVFYFGYASILIFWLVFSAFLKIKNERKYVAMVAILFGCFFNGGIMLPEFGLISGLILYSLRRNGYEDENFNSHDNIR